MDGSLGRHSATVQRTVDATPDLVGDEDAADRWGEHGRRARGAEGVCQGRAERGGVLGMLEDERRLEVDVRVEAGGQTEMAAHERPGLFVELQRLFFGHAS